MNIKDVFSIFRLSSLILYADEVKKQDSVWAQFAKAQSVNILRMCIWI